MAKRVSLRERRAGDARGIDAIFQESTPPQGDVKPVATENESPVAATPKGKPDIATQAAEIGKATEPDKPAVAKVTLYIRPDQVFAVEAIQLAERQRTGQKPDKSVLIQEALDLLIEKYRPL